MACPGSVGKSASSSVEKWREAGSGRKHGPVARTGDVREGPGGVDRAPPVPIDGLEGRFSTGACPLQPKAGDNRFRGCVRPHPIRSPRLERAHGTEGRLLGLDEGPGKRRPPERSGCPAFLTFFGI